MQENEIQFCLWMQVPDAAEPQPYRFFSEKTPFVLVMNEK